MIKFCWWCHRPKLWCHNLYLKYFYFKKTESSQFCWHRQNCNHVSWKKFSKTQKKLKELEIMYQDPIYICISWYSKICLFSVKKCWCQQNSRGVSLDSYIFWIFFRQGIIVPSFFIVGYMWQILGEKMLMSAELREVSHDLCIFWTFFS